MIDLEDALAPLVESAPGPPEVANVVRRARQRRLRRRGALATAVVVLVAGAAGAVTIRPSRHPSKVSVLTPPVESVRITLLDGSQLEISGPPSLGLTDLQPAFNGALGPVSDPRWGTLGHGFFVSRSAPTALGAVTARYQTADGHELVVHDTASGVAAVVQYGDWWLVATWDKTPASWAPFASALNATETADGFLFIRPTDPSWKLSPPDAPEMQLGGAAYGSGATYAFWGPDMYPAGCPGANEETRTTDGWPVSLENGAWWCDPTAHVRIAVWDQSRVDAALAGLHVASADAQHEVDRVTTLDGDTVEVAAPSSVLDQLGFQADVWVDGLDQPNLLNTTPNLLPVTVERATLPVAATSPSFATADGHTLYSYVLPTECACDVLAGTYGQWLVEIEVTGMSPALRTQIASLFAAHENSLGFLVIGPVTPMHLRPTGADILLDGVDISTAPPEPQIYVHHPEERPANFSSQIHVTRIDSVP